MDFNIAHCCGWQLSALKCTRAFFSHSDEVQADVDLLLGSDKVAQQRSSALFLLKLKEFRKLSQVAIDDIVQEWNGLFSHTLQRLHAEVRRTLAENGIDVSSVVGLPEVFQNAPSPFLGLETRHTQEKFYHETLGLVVSLCTSYLASEISFVSTFINLLAVEHDEVVFSDLSVAVPW